MPIRWAACAASPSNENRMAVGIIVNLEAPGMAIDPTSSLLFPVSIPAQMRGDFFIFHDPALGMRT